MSADENPWHAAFPAPTMTSDIMPQRRAMQILSMKIASLLIIDVRRTDYLGGCIRGSLNIPAQGFWWNRGMLYELAYKADIEWVVFTCNSCSTGGRGIRCAAWFLEHVRNVAEDQNMQVMALEGGVKGWVKAGGQTLMDGFDQSYWNDMFGKEDEVKQSEASESGAEANTGKTNNEQGLAPLGGFR